ncbi:hypothetical protein HDU96_000722 [Phlyctochytrium bullatum]|nr:hypothetical protein HDU96_000722 [Phlyctochytrium bullatum]
MAARSPRVEQRPADAPNPKRWRNTHSSRSNTPIGVSGSRCQWCRSNTEHLTQYNDWLLQKEKQIQTQQQQLQQREQQLLQQREQQLQQRERFLLDMLQLRDQFLQKEQRKVQQRERLLQQEQREGAAATA